MVDGIYWIPLSRGFGKDRPVMGRQTLVAMSYISYDERGVMKSEPHFALQEIDVAPVEWRSVLADMVAGERRRIWVRRGDRFQVYDLELQSIGVGLQ